MAMQFLDRVKVQSSTVGTGALTIGAAFANAQGFGSFLVGNTAYYVIEDGNAWECGIGTLTSSSIWARTAVLGSSVGGTTPISCSGNETLYLSISAQTITDTQAMAVLAPGRNRIRNPKIEIAQRGLGPFTVNANYTADGWVSAYTGTATSISASVGALTATGRTLAVTANGLTSGSLVEAVQRIESYDVEDLVGQPVTFSVTGSLTTSAGTISGSVSLYYPSARDSSANYTLIGTYPLALSATSGRVFATIPALPSGAANGLSMNINGTQAGATGNAVLTIGQVQLEPGTFATPLEHVDIATESAKNLRFLQSGSFLAYGYTQNGIGVGGIGNLVQPMRSTPTITYVGTGTVNCASGALVMVNPNQYQYTAVGSGSGGFIFEGNWTATAEL